MEKGSGPRIQYPEETIACERKEQPANQEENQENVVLQMPEDDVLIMSGQPGGEVLRSQMGRGQRKDHWSFHLAT